MIELPTDPSPNGVQPSLMDKAVILRPSTGAEILRVDRKGSRFRMMVTYPPMEPDTARVFIARLLRAKSEGLKIPYPLLDISQGSPGSPLVDGAGQAGTILDIKGLTVGYQIKEGYWLSIVDENGRHYLHNAAATVTASAGGLAALPITPELRWPFLNSAVIHIAAPMVEGFVDGQEWQWVIPVNKLIALEFPLEEAA